MSGLKRVSYSRPILLASAAASVAVTLMFVAQDESSDTAQTAATNEPAKSSLGDNANPAFEPAVSASIAPKPALLSPVDVPQTVTSGRLPQRARTIASRARVEPVPEAETIAQTNVQPLPQVAAAPITPEPVPIMPELPTPHAATLAVVAPAMTGTGAMAAADHEENVELNAGEIVTAHSPTILSQSPVIADPGSALTEAELLALAAVQKVAQIHPDADAGEFCNGSSERILPTPVGLTACNSDDQFAEELPTGRFAPPDPDFDDVQPALVALDGPESTHVAPNICPDVLDPRDCPGAADVTAQASVRPASHDPHSAGMTHYAIGVSVGGRAAQPVPIMIDRADNILIGVSGLLASVRSLMDPGVYARLATSSAASAYVNVEKLRSLGFAINFDDQQNALVLTAR